MVSLDEWEMHPIFGDGQPTVIDRWVFHYTTVERAASIALLQSMILSPLSAFNDPREARKRGIVTLTSGGFIGGKGNPPRTIESKEREAYEDRLRTLRRQLRVASYTRDGDTGEPGTAARADSRGFARPRMWAQYGDRHAGVCLIFDREALLNEAGRKFGDRVIADNIVYFEGHDSIVADSGMADFDSPDPDQHFTMKVLPALQRKNADWEAENEWRLFVTGQEADALLPIGESIAGLVAGVDFASHRLPVLAAIVQHLDIESSVSQLHVSDDGILTPYPMKGPDGDWHVWRDADLRRRGVVFDE